MSDLSARLFNLQKKLGIRQKAKIAEMLGCSRTMLYNYEQGDPHPPIELLSILAELEAGAGIEQMSTNGGMLGAAPNSSVWPVKLIPVLSWAHAGEAAAYDEIPASWQEKIPTECRDPKAFAVRLEGDSMESTSGPSFREGDFLIVQPSETAHSGCLVVARFANDGIIFRRFEMTGKTITLVPFNTRYQASQHEPNEFAWIYPVWGRITFLWRK